ncbi:Rho-type GTPase activating protein Rga1 [Gurleya vavrai]
MSIIKKDYLDINSIDKKDYVKYKKETIETYLTTLNKYFNKSEINVLINKPKNFIYNYFFNDSFGSKENEMVTTVFKYSKNLLYVPFEFDCLMTAITELDLKTKGIFRVNGKLEDVQKTEQVFAFQIERSYRKSVIVETLKKSRINDVCDLFVRYLTKFKAPLFPIRLRKVFEKIWMIENTEDRLICLKILYLGFPHKNRSLLESIGKFVKIVSDANTFANGNECKGMNILGLSTVLTPALVIKKGENMDFFKIKIYVGFFDFLFENMPIILGRDHDLLKKQSNK